MMDGCRLTTSGEQRHETEVVREDVTNSAQNAERAASVDGGAFTVPGGAAVPDGIPSDATVAGQPVQAGLNEAKPPSSIPPSWLWLRQHDQALIAVCLAIFLGLCGYHWARLSGWGSVPLEIDRLPARRYDFRIDINVASWIEFSQIEGIGEITAKRIIADREANGPFREISGLLRVKGIGPKTLDKMRPFLRDNSPINAQPTPANQ